MKLAYSTLACPGWTVEQAAEAAHRYGYSAIEWRLADGEVLTPQTPLTIKKRVLTATRQHNLTVACLDTSCRFVQAETANRAAVVQDCKDMIDLAVELEAPFVRVFGGEIPAGFSRADLLAPTAQALAESAEYAAPKGITVLLETHDDWSRSQDARTLVETANVPNLKILWDVHHPYRMGETPLETWQNLGGADMVAHMHIKDARRDDRKPKGWQLTLLEEGEVPVREAVQILQQNNFSGYIALEWEKKWHPEIEEPELALPQFAELLRKYLNEAA
jgi:sugar phosphate isomerase/epimerase